MDWLPSLVAAAGGVADTRLYKPGADGLNLWPSLAKQVQKESGHVCV